MTDANSENRELEAGPSSSGGSATDGRPSNGVGAFAIRHRLSIIFVTIAVCLGGAFSAARMPSSVFPETNFPRVVILIDNGIMPSNEMMATITRPIEEAVKNIPGVVQVRSSTGRGGAEVNVFFDWQTDMVQSELFVLNRIAQLKGDLPETAKTTVWRLTFNAFPILGVSMTSPNRDLVDLWERAQYDLKPRFLRIPGVGRVDLVGGRAPEFHIVLDPLKLAAIGLGVDDITHALEQENIIAPAGFQTENYTLYLTLIDGRAKDIKELEGLVVSMRGTQPVRLQDVARIERSQEPVFNVVNAQGKRAVLLNIRAQPSGSSILEIAASLKEQMAQLSATMPPDIELSFYYDQSLFVEDSVSSVWEAVMIGLIFALLILYAFLKNWGSVLTAIVVIPVSVLATIAVMYASHMTFNLMTLGGIAAAIGLIIDDAIVVVEAIHARLVQGIERQLAIGQALKEILHPIIGSTFTPVVVFIPLSFLDGLPGVFFRALALTMVVSLLTSLVLALTLTPALASLFLGNHKTAGDSELGESKPTDPATTSADPWPHVEGAAAGKVLSPLLTAFEGALRFVLHRRWAVPVVSVLLILSAVVLYGQLKSDFLPDTDEGGFVVDYRTPWGTSLEETDRMMREAEALLMSLPEVEGYSRRTGARLALALAEPNTGDFLVKLRPDRTRSTEEVKTELRKLLNEAIPGSEWEFPGILGDLIGDLTWSPKPIEVKLFSTDIDWLKKTAPRVQEVVSGVPGVVDTFDGLVLTGPTITFRVRRADAKRYGLSTQEIASVVNAALLGNPATSILEGDRVVDIRILLEDHNLDRMATMKSLPLRSSGGAVITLGQVADLILEEGQLELHREDLRQLVAVTGDLEGRDTGSAVAEIKSRLSQLTDLPAAQVEFGGLFEQQIKAFKNLLTVLILGIILVFMVLVFEFRSFLEPISIVVGAVMAMFGTIAALWITGTSLNIVSFLGAIIGVGIVAKNGILMLDLVSHLRSEGADITEALLRSGKRRLRPILMTSLATMLAMLPLAWGIGHGADMLRPMAIGIIGALSISMLFSLLVTPTMYYLLAPFMSGSKA